MAALHSFLPGTWVEIDLNRLKENYRLLKRKTKTSTRIMSIVKADAYGHGLIPIGRQLKECQTQAFGVSSIEEGILIRKKISSDLPVILLLGVQPKEAIACLRFRLTPVIYSIETALKLHRSAKRKNTRIPVHLKIDTGMGRLGVPWFEFSKFLHKIIMLNGIQVIGLTSHFGQADDRSNPYNTLQWKRYGEALDLAAASGIVLTENHMANSSALLHFQGSQLHYVRPGILLYGCDPTRPFHGKNSINVKPILSLKSRILQVKTLPPGVELSYGGTYITRKEETIAVLPAGYANGYPRNLSNAGEVLIRGRRFPIVGRVCMNLIMVRVETRLGLQSGEEAVLLGRQGNQTITPEELAEKAGTIPYELFCSIGRLNHRKYIGN